jgi:carboxypeptidase T
MTGYHCWHRSELDGAAPFSTKPVQVPVITEDASATATRETKQMGSLRNDMDELRRLGQQKGIVDGQRDIGKSHEGRELFLLKIGKGTEHKVFFAGCHHAREWISVEVPFLVAKYLIESYEDAPTDPKKKRIKHLLENRQIWCVPMTNPDGHFETTNGSNRWWRANRRKVPMSAQTIQARQYQRSGTRAIAVAEGEYQGVDINRNYPTAAWGHETYQGSARKTSRDPRDGGLRGIWCGPDAGSEPETKRIVDLYGAHDFRASISFHNFSQVLLYADDSAGDDYAQFVGKGMSALIDEKGNPYKYQTASALYPTTGDQMDFAWEKTKRPTFLPELRPSDAHWEWAFSALPEDQIEACFREMLPASLALINCAGFDEKARPQKIKLKTTEHVAQVVDHGWQPFKGWEP